MLMFKRDESSNTKATGLSLSGCNWPGVRFFANRRAREEEASARGEPFDPTSLSAKRRRMLDGGAHARRTALVNTDDAYRAAFEVDEDHKSEVTFFQHSTAQIAMPLEAVAEVSAVVPDRNDPSTWRRPNLEKLKASIRAEWKGNPSARAAV